MSDVESEYVIIESEDGFSFVVARQTAYASSMLKTMLDPNGAF
jgi:hypothetical protein